MAKPDPNRMMQWLPLIAGSLGGVLLFLNRMVTETLTPTQSRADALGVILSALLILVGLLWQRVQPRLPDAVELVGTEGFELAEDLSPSLQTELAWASHILLTNTVTRSVVVWYRGRVLLRRGVLGPLATVTPGAIVQRVLDKQRPVYLVDVKLYPGRVEFSYLPENVQGIICQPLGKNGVLILGANAPRSYTQQDEAWVSAIADKLDHTLSAEPVPAS